MVSTDLSWQCSDLTEIFQDKIDQVYECLWLVAEQLHRQPARVSRLNRSREIFKLKRFHRWSRLFSLIIFILAMTHICALTKLASAESCGQLQIVNPPKQDGGSFYRVKTGNGDESDRKGYLKRGMVVRLIMKNGDVVEEFMKDQEADKEFKYVRFIAPDGSMGLIRSSFVASLNKIYPNRYKSLLCPVK